MSTLSLAVNGKAYPLPAAFQKIPDRYRSLMPLDGNTRRPVVVVWRVLQQIVERRRSQFYSLPVVPPLSMIFLYGIPAPIGEAGLPPLAPVSKTGARGQFYHCPNSERKAHGELNNGKEQQQRHTSCLPRFPQRRVHYSTASGTQRPRYLGTRARSSP